MSNRRNKSIDIFKGLLVLGMITAHVLQFFSADQFPLNTLNASTFINIITFPGFFFAFGYVSYVAYFKKGFRASFGRMLKTAGKTLIAFYISGTAYLVLIGNAQLPWARIQKILILEEIPGYSEFLISFTLMTVVAMVFFAPLKRLVQYKYLFWPTVVMLLGATYIPYEAITSNRLGVLVGSTQFASFPVVQYLPFYLIGMYVANYKIVFSKAMLTGAAASTAIFVFYYATNNQLPGRFPPSIYWIVAPSLFLYAYYLISHGLSKWFTAELLQLMGRNTLFYLLASNILIFWGRNVLVDVTLSAIGSVALAALVVIFIGIMLEMGGALRAFVRGVPRHAPAVYLPVQTAKTQYPSLEHSPAPTK